MGLFQTAIMRLQDSGGTPITGGVGLPCQVDNLSIPYQMGGDMNMIAFDRYTIYSLGWVSPVPVRSNVFVDTVTGAQYVVEGNVAVYANHLEAQCTLTPVGSTP